MSRFIQFDEDVVGNDGHTYYKKVKYGIQKEDDKSVYLIGKNKNSINKLIKSNIKNISKINSIEKDSYRK